MDGVEYPLIRDGRTLDYTVPLQLQELRRGPATTEQLQSTSKRAGTTATTAELQPLPPKSGFADVAGHLSQVFRQPAFDAFRRDLNNHKSFDDICTYLVAECARIHKDHEMMLYVSDPWPSQTAVEHLVAKSSGYFIYAVTVIKFIDDQDFRPTLAIA
jgi:hypothetical protein